MIVRGIKVAGGTFPAHDLEPLRRGGAGRGAGPRRSRRSRRRRSQRHRLPAHRRPRHQMVSRAPHVLLLRRAGAEPVLHLPRAAAGERARPDRPDASPPPRRASPPSSSAGRSSTCPATRSQQGIVRRPVAGRRPDRPAGQRPSRCASAAVRCSVVPDVVGLCRRPPQQALQRAGFGVAVAWDGTAAGGAPGMVVARQPAAGTSDQGTVTIVVHGSEMNVVVPNVVGLAAADAQAALAAAGLGGDAPTDGSGGNVASAGSGRRHESRDRRARPPHPDARSRSPRPRRRTGRDAARARRREWRARRRE